MKASNWMSVIGVGAVAFGVLAASACGDDEETSDNNDGAGGEGASGSASSSVVGSGVSSSIASSTSSGAGGGEPGTGICGSELSIDGAELGVFDGCLSESCCDSFDPCAADADCLACLEGGSETPGCAENALYTAFQTCQDTSCPTTVCDTTLGYSSPLLNLCIEGSCCATFNACEADVACNACLGMPDGPACAADALFTAYTMCRDTSCPTDICGTQIAFIGTYESNDATETLYETNKCGEVNCCADLTACADPSANGFLEMDDPEVAACLVCLAEEAGCVGGAVGTAATAFNMCMATNCDTQ
jgi:hypothetical protein